MSQPLPRYGAVVYGAVCYARSQSGGKKMTQRLRVLLDFTSAPDSGLDEIAGAVIDGMTGNAAYPTPPVALTVIQTQRLAFSDAVAAQAQGGPAATAAKNDARETLVESLRQNAMYVQANCNNDLATLLSSGYKAADTNHAQHPLSKPVILGVINAGTGQLQLRAKPVDNARAYEARFAVVGAGGTPGPWQNGGLFTSTRTLILQNLTPGTMYNLALRAVGGSTGYSEWSDPISHMSL